MKTTTASTTTKGKVKKVVGNKPATKKTRQTGNKPAQKKAKASKGKVPDAKAKVPSKKKTAVVVNKTKTARAKMLFKIGDLVVHENGKIYKVVKPPYAKKTVITIDAVEQRAGKNFGDAKAMPTAKFVRPAKAGEKSATPMAGAKTKAASPTGKAKGQTEAASDKTVKAKKPTVASAMRALFAEHGLEATYAQAETAAKQAKPDTKFAKSHWAWYRAQYKKTVAAQSPAKA